jgi:CheY-like chemotaxis protein
MPKNLLVADDSLTIRKVIGMIFATEDFQIYTVDNGLDAINKTRELRPDILLADVMMPGKSGYEVCETLKADPATESSARC